MLEQPGHTPQLGQSNGVVNSCPIDLSATDSRLPMLVYVAREKHPTSYDHQKKAGAMNVQLRVSALLSNAPFIINFDCDHYINNSGAFRAALCFMLDRRHGDDTAFVQFPQRFDDVDPTDRYCNHNRVFFDATSLGLNVIQGPSYIGTVACSGASRSTVPTRLGGCPTAPPSSWTTPTDSSATPCRSSTL